MLLKAVVLFVFLKCIAAHPQLNSMENGQQLTPGENIRVNATKFDLEKVKFCVYNHIRKC